MSRPIQQEPQHVTDYQNNNTIFTVWKFKEGMDIKPAFERLCALVAKSRMGKALSLLT